MILKPTYIKEYEIYDVFYADGYFIIISPIKVLPLKIF